MNRPIISGIKPFPMFIFTSFSVVIIGFFFQLIAIIMGSVIFRIPLASLMDLTELNSPEMISAVKFIQILGALGTFVFSGLLLSFLYTGDWFAYFQLRHFPGVLPVILLVMIIVAGLPLVNYLTELNMKMNIPFEKLEESLRSMEDQTEEMMMKLLKADRIGGLLVNLFMIAIIPAVGEELIFRGLIQKHLSEAFKNVHVAILLTAIIFSSVHFQVFSFLPRFFLGLVLGYLLVFGRSLWYPIIAHFANNAIGVVFYFLENKEKTGNALEEIGTSESMPMMALVSLLTVGSLIWILKRTTSSNRPFRPGTGQDLTIHSS